MSKSEKFEKELKSLLEKYDATIEVGYDYMEDTTSVGGESIDVSLKEEDGTFVTEKLCDGWVLRN